MKANKLNLPEQTPHVVVDPLVDFTRDSFVRHYGVVDTEPIRRVVDQLGVMTYTWRDEAYMILCKSKYVYGQFEKDKGPMDLCITEEGRVSEIPEVLFQQVVSKTDNSLYSSNVDFNAMFGDNEYLGIEGLTTTSCVRKTVEDSRRLLEDRIIVIPRDAVATRWDRREQGNEYLDQLSERQVKDVIVVPSWRDIKHR